MTERPDECTPRPVYATTFTQSTQTSCSDGTIKDCAQILLSAELAMSELTRFCKRFKS